MLLGFKAQSRTYFEESLKTREKLAAGDRTNIQRKYELALALARCGMNKQAAELADTIRKTSEDPTFLFSAACGYALCISALEQGRASLTPEDRALQKRYGDQAIETLVQAVSKGYDDPVILESDPDLAPIQNDPRLKELLAKLRKH